MAENNAQIGLESLQQKIKDAMHEAQTTLIQELEQFHANQAQSRPGGLDASNLLDLISRFNDADSQVGLLNLLVETVEAYAPRCILLIRKGKAVHGWAGRGFSAEFMAKQLKRVKWPLDRYQEISQVIETGDPSLFSFSDLSDISDQISSFDGFVPLKSCFFPIKVKNKIAAILYCDSGSESRMEHREMIEVLARVAGTELTLVTSKLKKPKKASAPTPVVTEPAPEPVAPATPEPTPEPEMPQVEDLPSEPSFNSFSSSDSMPSLDTQAMEMPSTEAPSAPKIVSVPDAEEDPSIKKARRVARVLVSDLKLYNESTVETGCRNNDLYKRLQEDIDRSYKHYQERVSSLLSNPQTNYFKEELIRQLADGDESKLGPLPY